jgi:hypothetical protein
MPGCGADFQLSKPRRGFSFNCVVAAISRSGTHGMNWGSTGFDCKRKRGEVESAFCGSELDDGEAGDEPEVLQVEGSHIEAQMQGGSSDDQVLEADGDASGGLLTLNASSKLGDLQGCN